MSERPNATPSSELETLLTRLSLGPLDPADAARLQKLLKSGPEALDAWLDHCAMDAWLRAPAQKAEQTSVVTLSGSPSESSGKEGAVGPEPQTISLLASIPTTWKAGITALAACVALGCLVAFQFGKQPDSKPNTAPESTIAVAAPVKDSLPKPPHPAPDAEEEATTAPEPEMPAMPEPVTLAAVTQDGTGETPSLDDWKTLNSTGSLKHPALLETPAVMSDAARPVRFNRDVRPILSETCFHCHGPDEHGRRAELRLDLPEPAYANRDGIRAIVPGDLDKSEAWHRILSNDPDELMPPPESHLVLTTEQKDTLRRWIAEGAEYEGHWAFIPPTLSPVPEVSDTRWPANSIDRFVLQRLEEDGLKPSPEADRRTLIRRLSFDLTGLPPSLEEVRAFVADTSPDAYENLVDRLLESDHFGERMALQWLDQTRYADTNGYSIDGGRDMWLWRDWVINAYNQNLPFDQFTLEQLAGDLLPQPTPEQLIATGFNRNHMITHEGGTIPEENLVNYTADRVKTTSEIFLGLTMGCAQCHDHKYDPISQKDYYRFFAYFNTLDDKGLDGNAGINSRPSIEAKSPLPLDPAPVRERLKELRAELDQPRPEAQQEWEAELRYELAHLGENLKLHPMTLTGAKSPNRDTTFLTVEDNSLVKIHEGRRSAYTLAAKVPADTVTGLRLVFAATEESSGMIGHCDDPAWKGTFFLSGISVSSGRLPSDEIDLYSLVPIQSATASVSHPDFPPAGALDERNELSWTPYPNVTSPQHYTVRFAEPLHCETDPNVTVMVNFFAPEGGRKVDPASIRLYALTGNDDDTTIPAELQELLKVADADRTPAQRDKVRAYFEQLAPQLQPLRELIANHERRLDEILNPHPVMVMDTAAKPRQTFILERGDYAHPTTPVKPGTPEALPSRPGQDTGDRLGLAHWLTDPEHPLTARVTVNRYWQMLFGTGLVATSADFGSQGEWPSHPELLDWLAVTYVQSGWDTKALIKQIVMSATYRQSSNVSPELQKLDPGNRLLARGPRQRLQAEFIRDAALEVSGLLVPWVGGSSVNPGQPDNLWKEVSHYGSTPATSQVYVADRGLERHRRSMYTYWKRTVPPPNMSAFDAPNRELCVMRRSVTNTPLQALVLLNDPQFVEASQAFADRVLKETPDASTAERAAYAFEAAVGRPPEEAELRELSAAYEEQYAETNHETAAWTAIAQLVLNLSETITKR